MKRRLLTLVALGVLLAGGHISAHELPLETLTLEDAIGRVEYHSDYRAWQSSLTGVQESIQNINDKQAITLGLSGNLLSFTYNFDQETSSASVGTSLSLSKSALSGTTVSGSLSPTYQIRDSKLNAGWSLGFTQAIWPSPSLSSDRINLAIAKHTDDVLAKQYDYMRQNTELKIEELYRAAQLAWARVSFAETNLTTAHSALRIATQKEAIGEASEADMIAGQLGVLRAERDLESSKESARVAKHNLLAALDLDGDYDLAPLEISGLSVARVDCDFQEFVVDLEQHPLVLHYEYELARAEFELEAASEASKPEASLSITLGETNRGNEFQASLRFGYPILDGNQRISTLQDRQDGLENVEQSLAEAVENLRLLFEQAAEELAKQARDLEIAQLTLRQAELELEAARLRYEAGIIEESALANTKLTLDQAQLSYVESVFRYNLACRRLNCGIVGDLTLAGGAISR